MPNNDFAEFKARQREGWSHFTPIETFTMVPAAHLVRFTEVQAGQKVLDVGCGTGVVALSARRQGAKVSGLDLTPALLERAQWNAKVAGFGDIAWKEGDAEALPYPDASFDVVLSQFGHMFAPRAEVATKEMLRVLKPGGRIAFATWPPEHFIARMFALTARYMPPPPGVSPPPKWGEVATVRERLGDAVKDLFFDRGVMRFHTLSSQHYVMDIERTAGPIVKLVEREKDEPEKVRAFRQELTALIGEYFSDNVVTQHYLLSRATKR